MLISFVSTLHTLCISFTLTGFLFPSLSCYPQLFSQVAICRMLPSACPSGVPFLGKWEGITAGGTKNFVNNPHYLITTTAPVKLMIQLSQTPTRGDPSKKLGYMGYFLMRTEGMRMMVKKDLVVGPLSKLTNEQLVSSELMIDAPGERLIRGGGGEGFVALA
jgi:hypothetical protein